MINELKHYIKRNEGLSLKPYLCPAGKMSIGWGFNLASGITPEIAEYLLDVKVKEAITWLISDTDWYDELNDARQIVVADMVYNLGVKGFQGFKKMIEAIKKRNYDRAADELLNSNYARQVPNRAAINAEAMRIGVWNG